MGRTKIRRTSSAAPFTRAAQIEQLSEGIFDVVVVGSGITGAGVALDAAARGLRVALLERDDFASGTSSKSSKLVHGGLRYLQQGEITLVYEALHERQRLLRNAPHLVSLLPFLIPMFARGGTINPKLARAVGGAMWGYDLTGGFRVGKLHRRVDRTTALSYMPTLDPQTLVSGYLYYDCTADDARLVVTIARTAALDFGATVVNGAAVVGLGRSADGLIDSVEAVVDGRTLTIPTRSVVNAAGVWSDDVRALDEGTHPHSIRPAKGIHISVPWDLVRNTIAAVLPVPGDKRSIFVVPHDRVTYVGTTDTDYDGPLDDPQCTVDDVDYLLRALNAACNTTITRSDVIGSWAGLRPLVSDVPSGRTADLSRRHKVRSAPSGMVTITGGKLTTYREMAADTVDALIDGPLASLDVTPHKSPTAKLALRGASGFSQVMATAPHHRLGRDAVEHLAHRYGGEATLLLDMIDARPDLAEPIVEGLPYLAAEAIYAARCEMARSVDDILSRRTRALIFGRDASAAAAGAVATLVAGEFGWSADDAAASAAHYRAVVERELLAAPTGPAAELPETTSVEQ